VLVSHRSRRRSSCGCLQRVCYMDSVRGGQLEKEDVLLLVLLLQCPAPPFLPLSRPLPPLDLLYQKLPSYKVGLTTTPAQCNLNCWLAGRRPSHTKSYGMKSQQTERWWQDSAMHISHFIVAIHSAQTPATCSITSNIPTSHFPPLLPHQKQFNTSCTLLRSATPIQSH
jgi:hypothetical protein